MLATCYVYINASVNVLNHRPFASDDVDRMSTKRQACICVLCVI